jgi:hypothetical protein
MLRGQGNELFGGTGMDPTDQKHPGAVLDDRCEGRFEITIAGSGGLQRVPKAKTDLSSFN